MEPLRYLTAADVVACMPPIAERLELAERALRALGSTAEMPPKIGVHPRQAGSLAHAMPALLRGLAADGLDDLLGVKWIAGFPANPSQGLATYSALVVLNDPRNGQPLAILDAAAITAQRTAAVSGAAVQALAPRIAGRPVRVAVLGAGAQARSHIPVIGYLLPDAEVLIVDVDSSRAAEAARVAATTPGIGSVRVAATVRDAVADADVVVSVVSFGPDRQALDPSWLKPEMLFVAVDYDMQAPAALARRARFVVDERDQFLAARSPEQFAGYPDPDVTLGEVLRAVSEAGGASVSGGADSAAAGPDGGAPGGGAASPIGGAASPTGGAAAPGGAGGAAAANPASPSEARSVGRILVSHLGVGLADVVFAAAILARAESLGVGRLLPR